MMGMSGKVGIAIDTAGNVANVARSTGHMLAHNLDTRFHTRKGCSSRDHTPEPLPRGAYDHRTDKHNC